VKSELSELDALPIGPVDEGGTPFSAFLRSAGKLAIARQVSALVFLVVITALPALVGRAAATEFAWAYFAMLTLSSLLGLGFERLAATVVATRGVRSPGAAVAPLCFIRLLLTPAAALALWMLFAFVGVNVSTATWCGSLVWIVAALLEPTLFGALRANGNSTVEPVTMLVMRSAQSVALLGFALGGASVAVLVVVVAAVEVGGVAFGFRALGGLREMRGAWRSWREVPIRRAIALAGIDIVGLVNLRADLLIVGRVLGAALGATYGLLYRAVDGFDGVVGSAGAWLYAESSNERDGGTASRGLRARSLTLLPHLGVAVGLVVVVGAGVVGSLVPRLQPEVDALRYLAAAFPIMTVNAIELHVRSGLGRNREVLLTNCATVALNVPLCVVLVLEFGIPGAALALVLSELWRAMLLWVSGSRRERALVGGALFTAVAGAVALITTGRAISESNTALAIVAALASLAVVVYRIPRWSRRAVVVP
jgi:O-antigen/teichoic acid export membrane protein